MTNTQPPPLLTACETEPIRYPGTVQPHGALLVVSVRTGRIEAASESCQELLDRSAPSLLGQLLDAVLGPEAAAALQATAGDVEGEVVEFGGCGRPLMATSSSNAAGQCLVAIEVNASGGATRHRGARRLAAGWRGLPDAGDVLAAAADDLRELTGFDRVMVYRFDEDWNGEVVAESRIDGIEPFLGLHYPASDIPQQARELYRLIRVRVIPDVHYEPSALVAPSGASAIDLGTCNLRSVSPVHLEYCRNMGVRATLVISLLVEGRLWGLLACHHYAGARHVGAHDREELAALCDDLSELLSMRLLQARVARQQALAARRLELVSLVRAAALKALVRQSEVAGLLDVVNADGFALVEGDEVCSVGRAPAAGRVRQIMARREALASGSSPLATHRIGRDLGLESVGDGIAGALFVSVGQRPCTTLVWFRCERAQTVRWAGNPQHAHVVEESGRITPRKSFAQFLERVRGESLPWSAEERASAAELASLIEIDALRQREALLNTMLDSLSQQLCVLNSAGCIVMVNRAWREFGRANGASESTCDGIGLDYGLVCAQAAGVPDATEAQAAWEGIRAVMDRRSEQFVMDYACSSPAEPRWFQMSVLRMREPCEGVVIVHADVTAQRRAWMAMELAEKCYRDVVQDMTDSVLRVTADGCVRFANDAACRYFERSREELLGTPWQTLVRPEDAALHDARVRAVTPEYPSSSAEVRVATRSGQERWGHFVNHVIFDGQGRMTEVQSVGRDITDRKASEAQVQRLLREQQAILNSRVIGIFKLRDGRIAWANAACAGIYGYPIDEMLGQPMRMVFASDQDFNAYEAAICRLKGPDQVHRAEMRHRGKDDRPVWVEVVTTVLDGEAGELIGAVVDIAHLKAAEAGQLEHRVALEALVSSRTRALAQARDDAQAANRAKSAFLSSMSHELRTPMNVFMGLTTLALRRATEPKQADQLGKALLAADGLLSIINDVLDVSRIEAGKVVIESIPFELADVFAKLESLAGEQARQAKLALVMQMDPALRGERLLGDPQRLGQVLLNLVVNGIKFTPEGSVMVRALRLSDQLTRIHVRFEVQDTGIGIAGEDQSRIFSPFEQADGSTTRRYGGSGLGLSICRRLVALMGGEIGIESELGVGSTFWCSIWLDRAESKVAGLLPTTTEAVERDIQLRHAGERVLVVDDEPFNREVVRSLLEACGLTVDEAEDGRQAVEAVERSRCALILMDVHMPALDGYGATRRIRETTVGGRIPIIAMTANVFQEDRAACQAAGMDDFLGKPIRTDDLFGKVLHWLDRQAG